MPVLDLPTPEGWKADADRNPEWYVVVMCNADVISETYEDNSNGKTANSSISSIPLYPGGMEG